MSPTSRALLTTIATTDSTVTPDQLSTLRSLIDGRPLEVGRVSSGPLLLTQKQAAELLSVSRVTLWRMTKDGIFSPVEILPGTFRYRREEIEEVARKGTVAESS